MLTAERLRELLHYESETGLFRRAADAHSGRWKAGEITGCVNAIGYVVIRVEGQLYLAQRLAWLHMTGSWPADEIDHIDRNRANNRWANLREAVHQQNTWNHSMHSTNTSGMTGVHRARRGKWFARIKQHGAVHHLGTFVSLEEAIAARRAAEIALFGEFAPIAA